MLSNLFDSKFLIFFNIFIIEIILYENNIAIVIAYQCSVFLSGKGY